MRPISFLFNGDEAEIQGSFARCVLGRMLEVILQHAENASFDVRIGTLPLTHFTYKIEAVEKKKVAGRLCIGHTLSDDKDLRKALAVDFGRAVAARWPKVDSEHLPIILLTHNIECVTISDLDESTGEMLHQALGVPGYLGCFEVDLGNPVLLQLVFKLLPPYYRYVARKLQVLHSPWEDDCHGAEWAEGLSLESVEISREPPTVIETHGLSEHGKRSLKLISERAQATHSELVLSALLDQWHSSASPNDVEEEVRFRSAEKGVPIADVRKLRDYALNEEHPVGKHKARLFRELLAVTKDDWRFVAEQLVAGLQRSLIERPRKSEHGLQYQVDVPVQGRNGVTKLVTSAWIIRSGEPPQLTTAFIAKLSETSRRSVVSDHLAFRRDDWQSIFEKAHAAASGAASDWTPTPMFIGDSIVAEGECGSAWVIIKDGRSQFARWLRKSGHAYPGHRGGVTIFASTGSQSVERARKYCEAFASVLHANGVECSTDFRLD